MHLLFVYGTLKDGHGRSAALADQRFIGTAKTIDNYVMYNLGSYPGLKKRSSQSAGKKVIGELYEVSDECISILDGIEGVDFGLFAREEIILDEFTITNLPIFQSTFAKLHRKLAQAYIYLKDTSECKDAGIFWSVR